MRGNSGDRLCVDVLGPIRVRDAAGRDITPDGALQRRLLALLVLRRDRVVSVDAAVEALWPSSPPRDPVAALHNHLFRLRRRLPADAVDSLDNGYRVASSRIDLDADRLSEALTARIGDPAALATIDAVLDRWHGPAYPELDDFDEARVEATRLGELRIRAVESQSEHRLAAGDIDGQAAVLAALVQEEPLRERPRALLMEALARGGRTVEALRVYDDFRRLLGDELGIEPSPALAAQHAGLLGGTDAPAWKPASQLPAPVSSLIGRDELLATLTAIVENNRLVTLIGPGGVGKSRLLAEVGHRLRALDIDRPVVMCELATAGEDSAADAVAAALGIDGRPGVALVDRIASLLGDAVLVLLLDNCEHVLEPVASFVQRVLGACPNVTIITTSRERLRVAGERLCTVPPLPVDVSDSPAVELFVERARAVSSDFDPDPHELSVIGEIVRRLDGLPLAIELAAARLNALDVAEVAAGLDRRFALLSAGYRTSSRHGSLGAAMAWSFELLDARLQRTFASLSVFAGPFTVADAAVICGIDEAEASGALGELVDRSLAMRTRPRRFVLLETLRAFAADRLAAAGRAGQIAERHAHHQVDWAERADRRLIEEQGARAIITEVEDALPELRTALGWLLDEGDVERAGRLVAALLDFGLLRLRPDVLAWSERVAAADQEDRSPMSPLVWAGAAYAAWMAGDLIGVAARCGRAIAACERFGRDVPSEVCTARGSYELFEGRLSEAVEWYRRGAVAARNDRAQLLFVRTTEVLALGYAGDPSASDVSAEILAEVGGARTPHAAYAWYCAGEADLALGVDLDRARRRFERALELAELTNASFVVGLAGASKASIDARIGDPVAAAEDYRRLITHWRRAGMWSTQWTMLRSIAALLARLGRFRDAAILEGAVRATSEGHRIFGADEAALNELGSQLRAELGDDAYDEAQRDGAAMDADAAVEHALRAL